MQAESSLIQIDEIGRQHSPENGDYQALVDDLRGDVASGLLDAHTRLHNNAGKMLEIASFCYALVELLVEKGIITFDELDERQENVSKRLVEKFAEQGIGVMALQNYREDKYSFDQGVEIDCASRVHLCKAACCRLNFALSKQDIAEGRVAWDFGEPYMIAQGADGYCRHIERASCRCTIWQHRPIPCRGYDCREDERIWLDFELAIINPDLDSVLSQGRSGDPKLNGGNTPA